MMFITAYGALIFDAQVKSGDFVITPAASGSVGLAAIQIANYAGATPITLTATSDKRSSCARLAQCMSLQPRSKMWSPK
jgi:NADPH:quinone reductase-like Zn-dependent oxidoreductase